jgi:Calmodulin-binding
MYLTAEKISPISSVFLPSSFSAAKKFVRADPPRKPALPSKDEAPLYGLKSEKDFVVANAVDAILTVPKVKPKVEPDWVHKPEYGRTPSYLQRVKSEIEAEHEYIQSLLDQKQMEEEAASGVRMRELTSGEREELIEALKKKWDAVNKVYQKTTFKNISTSNSTIGEIRFKENCEKQLIQVEKDIARLSVKAPIFVVDDETA